MIPITRAWPRAATCPDLAQQEGLGVVEEDDCLRRRLLEDLRQLESQVDAEEPFQLPDAFDRADAVRVVERAWCRHSHARDTVGNRPRGVEDRCEQVGA